VPQSLLLSACGCQIRISRRVRATYAECESKRATAESNRTAKMRGRERKRKRERAREPARVLARSYATQPPLLPHTVPPPPASRPAPSRCLLARPPRAHPRIHRLRLLASSSSGSLTKTKCLKSQHTFLLNKVPNTDF
jgi:hypothetical protein